MGAPTGLEPGVEVLLRGFGGLNSLMQLYDGTQLFVASGTLTFPFDTWNVERIEFLAFVDFRDTATLGLPLFLSAVTIGELRQGVEAVRHRGDVAQAMRLSRWLGTVTSEFADAILPFDEEIAQIWARLRVPHAENPLDEQIAATALSYDLTVVTRNVSHFEPTGVRILNPFT